MEVIQTGYHGLHAVDTVALDCKHALELVVILNQLMMALHVVDPAKRLKIVNIQHNAQVGWLPSGHTTSLQRRNLVENRLKRRQRDINVILTSFCERWFNIRIQTSKQRRYNVRRFDLKFRLCFNVGLTLSYG